MQTAGTDRIAVAFTEAGAPETGWADALRWAHRDRLPFLLIVADNGARSGKRIITRHVTAALACAHEAGPRNSPAALPRRRRRCSRRLSRHTGDLGASTLRRRPVGDLGDAQRGTTCATSTTAEATCGIYGCPRHSSVAVISVNNPTFCRHSRASRTITLTPCFFRGPPATGPLPQRSSRC